MADLGQRVIFGADREVKRTRAGPREECGRQVASAALDRESRSLKPICQPWRRMYFFEAELRLSVNPAAERHERIGGIRDSSPGGILGAHREGQHSSRRVWFGRW